MRPRLVSDPGKSPRWTNGAFNPAIPLGDDFAFGTPVGSNNNWLETSNFEKGVNVLSYVVRSYAPGAPPHCLEAAGVALPMAISWGLRMRKGGPCGSIRP